MYDWKERQPRVDHLLRKLRALDPEFVLMRYTRHKDFIPYEHVVMAKDAIQNIEEGNDEGKSFVAVAGLVLAANASPQTP